MSKLLSRQEAAQMLGIGVSALDEIRRSGCIEFIQYVENGKVFFTENGINKFIETSTHHAIHRTTATPTYRKCRR